MPLGHPSLRRNIHRGVFLRFLGFNGVFKDDALEFLKKAREMNCRHGTMTVRIY
jgi:hypothetical protein